MNLGPDHPDPYPIPQPVCEHTLFLRVIPLDSGRIVVTLLAREAASERLNLLPCT
jgi:hypothetical protein